MTTIEYIANGPNGKFMQSGTAVNVKFNGKTIRAAMVKKPITTALVHVRSGQLIEELLNFRTKPVTRKVLIDAFYANAKGNEDRVIAVLKSAESLNEIPHGFI